MLGGQEWTQWYNYEMVGRVGFARFRDIKVLKKTNEINNSLKGVIMIILKIKYNINNSKRRRIQEREWSI